ncbi:MAG: hypothetical protein Q4G42_00095 [Neisseria sp.]|nr:hypothetical protein [Neisseria sp.]
MRSRETRVFALALAASLLLHLAIPAAGLLRGKAWDNSETKPVTVRMQSYTLNKTATPTAPEPTPAAPPAAVQTAPDTPRTTPPSVTNPPTTPEATPPAPSTPPPETAAPATPAPEIQAASEPLYMPDGSLNAANPAAWELLEQERQAAQRLTYAQNLDAAAASQPELNQPLRAQKAYDIIALPGDARPSFPKDAQLRYEGPFSITGDMHFSRTADTYHIEATFNVPFNKMQFRSEGKIQNGKLIPLQYSDTRKGKLYASAIFDYEQKVIRYGKGDTPTQSVAMEGAQHDFFSWAWQMSIDGGYMPGTVQLTNGKKGYLQTTPPAEDIELEETLYDTGEGKIRIIRQSIDRERGGQHDSIDYGFAPDFANIPALIVFNDGGKVYEMRIIGIKLDNQNYWQAVRRASGKER